jgi:hypothetical protein
MSMMGVGSVEYHEQTVAGRADDPVIAAAAYYASRGETPMTWGGQGCRLLGLAGEVDLGDYRAIFGAGGAHDPNTGTRLVGCRRPGLEIAPHRVPHLPRIDRKPGSPSDVPPRSLRRSPGPTGRTSGSA